MYETPPDTWAVFSFDIEIRNPAHGGAPYGARAQSAGGYDSV